MSDSPETNDKKILQEWDKLPMRKPFISKVTVNISVGKSGEPLRRAMTILEAITNQKPVQIQSKQTIRDWGVHKKEPVACKVTLRNESASHFLTKAFDAADNRLLETRFDTYGNFGFGISEHILLDLKGAKYDPNLGITGMDILVSFARPGFRIRTRKLRRKKIPMSHRLTPDETKALLRRDFPIDIVQPEEEEEY
ncbi:MAG: 50S ribosomal protein L5 [Candidatus Heimdallarchaeota archaeon]|nr:50S ribosomal protein L5 [Candidatus Heimdallarchaeota archaeon]